MTAQTILRTASGQSRMPSLAVRSLTVSAGVLTAAALWAAPAQADPIGDSFLAALTNAGVNYSDPGATQSLGQSICPMLAQPGGTFASVATSMAGSNGMSPQMAALFTSIAISMYCPTMMSSLANGNWANGNLANMIPIPGL